MLLSIVIVNYRSWASLERCLTSVFDRKAPAALAFDVIVVDNDSGDGRLEEYRRRFRDVRFLRNEANYGFAHACNLGARQARGELLLFLNPDTIAPCSQIERLVREKTRHPGVAILTARQVDRRGRQRKAFDAFPSLLGSFSVVRAVRRRLAPGRYPDPRGRHRDLVDCDWVSGSVVLISVADFEKLDGWSEAFWMYCEDIDLCRRAADLGMRVAFTPEAELVHLHGGSSRADATVSAVARSEAVISRHVYLERHFRGLHRKLIHAVVASRSLALNAAGGLLDFLTVRRVPQLNARSRVLQLLVTHYVRVWKTGRWLSTRSALFARRGDPSVGEARARAGVVNGS